MNAFVAVLSFFVVGAGAAESLRLASAYGHTAWTATDGLPNPVKAVVQTPDGYLWLGTGGGLYRFDGRTFVRWQPDDGRGFESRSVLALLVTRGGELWVGFGSGGAARISGGAIVDYSNSEGAPRGGVQALAETPDGTIWAGGQYGIAKFSGGRWSPVGKPENYAAPAVQRLFCDGRGRLWAATDGFDFKLNSDGVRTNAILRLDPGAAAFESTGIGVGMISAFFEDKNGAVWTSEPTSKAIFRVDGGRESVSMANEPTAFVILPGGRIVAGSLGNGMQDVQTAAGGGLKANGFGVSDGLSGAMVFAATIDREGNLWFGTSGGLDRFRPNKVISFNARDGLDPDQQIAVTTTNDGVVRLFGYTGSFFWSAEKDGFRRVDLGADRRILSFAAGRDGLLLGGSFKIANVKSDQIDIEKVEPLEDEAAVEAIAEDAAGNLWVTASSNKGTGRIFRRTGDVWEDVRTFDRLPPFRCRVIYPDAGGSVWLGFENGDLARIDGRTVEMYPSSAGIMPGGAIYSIVADGAGGVLVGGEGGLTRINGPVRARVGEKNGLPGNSVFGIVTDRRGDYWLAGARGIIRVAPDELARAFASPDYRIDGAVFDASDGLGGLPRQRQPFPVATRAGDGRLWFATSGGVAVIDPENLPKNMVAPPVSIDAVRADDRSLNPHAVGELPSATRTLEFHFAALSLAAPEKIRYRFRLDGFDDDWRDAATTPIASYTGLAPGDYRFRVIASNNDGVWNEVGAALDVRIKPAFYQTRWFGLAVAAVVVLMLIVAYRLRVAQVTRRMQAQFEERLAERTRIARELHDTLLQGVVSASMHLSVALHEVPAEVPGRPRLERLKELIGEVVADGRNTVRGLRADDPEDCDIEEKLARVAAAANADGASANFSAATSGTRRVLHPIVADEVFAIAREALVNAFRHSRAAEVRLSVDYLPNILRVRVADDGCGVPAEFIDSGRTDHFGLKTMKERAASVGGRLRIANGDDGGGGATVELIVPAHLAYRDAVRESWIWRLRKRLGMTEDRGNSM